MVTINTSLTSNTNSGNLRFSGLTSGIDSQATIDAIINARRAPAVDIEARITANTSKVAAYEELKTLASNFATTLDLLRGNNSVASTNIFEAKQSFLSSAAGSGAAADYTPVAAANLVGVTTGQGAATGSHTVTVQQIAKAHQIRGDAFDSTTTTVDSTTPAVTAGSFTINGETITISASDTLLDIRDKINASSANVNATIVSASSTENYLVITADDTGEDAEIVISNTTTSQDLGLVNSGDGSIKNLLRGAQNAIIDVDGITGIERQSNSIDDVIEGVTLSLFAAEADTDITIDIENDLNSIKTTINQFVDDYNAIRQFIIDQRTQMDRDEDGEEDDFGPLAFDSTLTQITNRLNALIASEVPGLSDGYQSLGQVGIEINEDFELEMDEDVFDTKIITDVESLEKLFAFDFSSSDSRLTYVAHNGSPSYTVDGSNVVEPYYVDIDGTDGDGDVTGANADTSSGTTGTSFSVSGSVLTMDDDTFGLDGMTLFFNGGASLSAVNDIEISFTRGIADQLYYFFNDISKTDGTLDTVIENIEDQNDTFEEKVSLIDARLEVQRQALERQFIAMEALLAQLESTRSAITQFTDAQNSDN